MKKKYLQNEIPYNFQLSADADVIRIVLRNLISNSVKFCQQKDSFRVSVTNMDDHYRITCRDTGPGFEIGGIDKFQKK